MATSMLELGVGTGKWDAGLKKAKQSLDNFTQANGGLQQALEKESQKMQKFVQMMGQMDSTAKTAKGQMNDYKATIEQLTMQYNRMSEAQKQAIGQTYLQAIEQMKQKYQSVNEEIQEMNRSLNNVKLPDMKDGGGGLFAGLGDKMGGMLQVFGGNMLTKAAGAVASLGSEMLESIHQGVELARQGEGIRNAFERLGRGDILDGLREATHGTVTDIELMKAAVKFNDFKLPLDELGTMLAFAQQKAKDTGQSVDYMVDSIVTGLGRKSLMILDNLGLSATEVKDKMAETGDMTKAVGAIIREQMAKAGDYVETAADRAAQANVSLQNKMEELGRKFAPLQEASDNLWTSMKIGIMNIIGGPLTDLLNKLTEAGRLASAYGVLGGNAKVGRMTANLSSAREENRQSIYQQQQQQFWRYINPREQQIKDIRAWQSGQRGEALQGRINAITEKYGSLDVTKIQAEVDAAKKMLADYQSAAKQILQPIKQEITPTITTSGGTTGGHGGGKGGNNGGKTTTNKATPKTEEQQNTARIAELVKQYQDLATAAKTADDAQKAGLTERMTKIQGEIKTLEDRNTELKKFADEARQVQFPVGSLPQLNEQLKTLQTEQAKALDAKQWKDYQQQIEQTQYQIDALKGKWKDGLQATFKLNIEQQGSTDINTAKPDDITVTFKADDADVLAKLRDIEGVNIDPKTLTVTAQTQDAITALQRVDGLTIQPKTAEVTFKADDADVLAKLRDIEGVTIDPKTLTVTAKTADAYNQVQQLLKSVDGKTVTFAVQPMMETGTSIQNDAGMSGYIASIKQQLETADYGTSLYNGLSAQLADMNTLQNLVGASLKAGLGTAMFDAADATGKDFWTRAMEGGVEDTDWQAIVDKINEKLKEMNLKPIAIDFKTGEVNEMTKDWKNTASAIQSVGQAMSQIEDPAAKVMGTIAQAIATIALTFASSLKGTVTPWDWIAAAAAGTATMISTISAIHSATGFAEGGMIKGNSYSGDNIGGLVDGSQLVGLNAGEVVLNTAQTSNVAAALTDGGREVSVHGRLVGEDIFISADRYARRSGRGEILTWKHR